MDDACLTLPNCLRQPASTGSQPACMPCATCMAGATQRWRRQRWRRAALEAAQAQQCSAGSSWHRRRSSFSGCSPEVLKVVQQSDVVGDGAGCLVVYGRSQGHDGNHTLRGAEGRRGGKAEGGWRWEGGEAGGRGWERRSPGGKRCGGVVVVVGSAGGERRCSQPTERRPAGEAGRGAGSLTPRRPGRR